MKHWNRRTVGAVAALLLGIPLPAAAAGMMQSDMEVDWTTFKTTTSSASGPAPVLTWSDLSSTVNGYTSAAVSTADWTSALSAHVGTATSFADSALDAGSLRASAQDGDTSASTSGSVWTLRQADFSVSGTGNVEMTVGFTWHAFVQPAPGSSFGQSFSYAYASLAAWSTGDPRGVGQRGGQVDIFPQIDSPPQVGPYSGSGTLVLDFNVINGDVFTFTGAASATDNLYASTVPWPASSTLFLAGLAVVLAQRRAIRLPGLRTARRAPSRSARRAAGNCPA